MEWTDDTIQRLRAFWAEGLSTAEIGRRLGVSKNAVVGKAHRLDLTARPSPIHWDGPASGTRRRERRPVEAPRPDGPTLPPLHSSATGLAPENPTTVLARPPVARTRHPEPTARPAIAAAPVAPPLPLPSVRPVAPRPEAPQPRLHTVATGRTYGRVVTCCWPLGDPGTKSFRFCDAASIPGKPYCAEHAQIAYVKIRDRREDAA